MALLATGPALACFTSNLRVRTLPYALGMCLAAVGTLAGLSRRSSSCTGLSLTLLCLARPLLTALTLLLPSADGRKHLVGCSSFVSKLIHSRHELVQRVLVSTS